MQILQPEGWRPPVGYSNGIVAEGKGIFIAGQIGWNAAGEITSDNFVDQTRQALANIVAVLSEASATPATITRLTWFVVNKHEYLANKREVGEAYREIIGDHYPAMSLIQVTALLEDRARVEIEATAVLPVSR